MKVYIVVATYGEYEDAVDEVVKAFTNREKAETCLKENEKKRLENLKRYEFCLRCPQNGRVYKDLDAFMGSPKETPCGKRPIVEDIGDGYEVCCFIYSWNIPEHLRIEEIEVEE